MSGDWPDDDIADLLRAERANPGLSSDRADRIYGQVLASIAPSTAPAPEATTLTSSTQAVVGGSAVMPKVLLILGGLCAGAVGTKLAYDNWGGDTVDPVDRFEVHQAIVPSQTVDPQPAPPQPSDTPAPAPSHEPPPQPSERPTEEALKTEALKAEALKGEDATTPHETPSRPARRSRRKRSEPRTRRSKVTQSKPSAPTVTPVLPPKRADAEPRWAAERRLIADARSALKAGVPRLASVHLRTHRERFATGQLAQERDALAVRVLWAQGKKTAARAAARQFRQRYPRSLLWPGIQTLVGLSAGEQ